MEEIPQLSLLFLGVSSLCQAIENCDSFMPLDVSRHKVLFSDPIT